MNIEKYHIKKLSQINAGIKEDSGQEKTVFTSVIRQMLNLVSDLVTVIFSKFVIISCTRKYKFMEQNAKTHQPIQNSCC